MEKIIKNIENIENPVDNIFADNVEKKKRSIGLIHRAYLTQIKNSRKYLASTKTKSEVRGGGKKPWKQKGTGNARAGSSRSPLWKGGGVTFGPKPRSVKKKINKKERRLAILSALYLKKQQFIFVDDLSLNSNVKTKTVTKLLTDLGLKNNEKRDTKYSEKLIYERMKDIDKRLAVIKLFIKDKDQQESDCLNVNETKYPDLIKEYNFLIN